MVESRGFSNPVLVEVTRGNAVESRHRGAVAVVDAAGNSVHAWGDPRALIYPRSALKPLQALSWIETGAAETYRLTDKDIALACASHSGEPVHVAGVASWLSALGLTPDDLECGPHAPIDSHAASALTAAGEKPGKLHNNCSGKHAGFLTGVLHMQKSGGESGGETVRGYTAADHPAQRRMIQVLEDLGGVDLTEAPRGIDGCGIPVLGMPLVAVARAMAKLADPGGLEATRTQATHRVVQAMIAEPGMVAGRARFDTHLITATRGTVITKGGAEGVFAATVPKQGSKPGLGIALKIDDGAKRAAEVAMGAVLNKLNLLESTAQQALRNFLEPSVVNTNGESVGVIRSTDNWAAD